jgi:hypothetical protein
MRPSVILVVAGVVAVLVSAGRVEAKLTLATCAAQKRAAWTNLRKCQGVEDVKRIKGKAADFAKCDAKLQAKLAQISGKAVAAGVPCRFAESDDGTIIDYDLGLQWEEKTGGRRRSRSRLEYASSGTFIA